MKNIIPKKLSSRLKRGIRIYALVCVVASIVSVSAGEVLMSDASAVPCIRTGYPAGCTDAPEIPLAMIPLFLLVSAGGFYVVRRRSLIAHA